MYTSVKFILCNGQNISYQYCNGCREVKQDLLEETTRERMERSDLTLSFHNLIKRGSACAVLVRV